MTGMLVLSAAASHQFLLCCMTHHSARQLSHHTAVGLGYQTTPQSRGHISISHPSTSQKSPRIRERLGNQSQREARASGCLLLRREASTCREELSSPTIHTKGQPPQHYSRPLGTAGTGRPNLCQKHGLKGCCKSIALRLPHQTIGQDGK